MNSCNYYSDGSDISNLQYGYCDSLTDGDDVKKCEYKSTCYKNKYELSEMHKQQTDSKYFHEILKTINLTVGIIFLSYYITKDGGGNSN